MEPGATQQGATQPEPRSAGAGPLVELPVPAALGLEGVAHLLSGLEVLADGSVRILVLRGTNTCFCRGMDLAEIMPAFEPSAVPAWERAIQDFAKILQVLRATAVMTVAVVEGPAMGGGVGLAAACDFVVASEGATFALPELLLGLVPATILPVLAERLGLHPAKRWAMTQATWKADEAKVAGLVDHLVPTERLEVELRRLLRVLLRSHPRGVANLKQLAREIRDMGQVRAIERGQTLLTSLLGQAEVRQELVAFRDFGLLPGLLAGEGDS
jgi:enoyl-CoA hydratase/carnithine racemase